MADNSLPPDIAEFLKNPTPIDYGKVPEEIRDWLRIEVEQDGKRGLYEESTFWRAGRNTVRNEDGYEVEQVGPFRVQVRSPEGDDVSLQAQWWTDGTDNVVGFDFPEGLKWDETDEELSPADLHALIDILVDAFLAFETHAKFKVDPAFKSLDA
jgi:hypothetical protein